MAVLTNTMLQGTSAFEEDAGFKIEKSLRFNEADSPSLKRATSLGNRKTWTWSGWIKRADVETSGHAYLFGSWQDGDNATRCMWATQDQKLQFYQKIGGTVKADFKTNAIHRDAGAWMHVVVAYDSPNAVESERVKIYVNGEKQVLTQATAIPQNAETWINKAGEDFWNGALSDGSHKSLKGYLAEVRFIDGLALAPAAFGSFDSTGVWNPKEFALPTPNQNITWSNGLSHTVAGSAGTWHSPAVNAFNSDISSSVDTYQAVTQLASGNQELILTWVPPTELENVQQLRVSQYASNTNWIYVRVNEKSWVRHDAFPGWVSATDGVWMDFSQLIPSDRKISKIEWKRTPTTTGDGINLGVIEVNGVALIDGQTDPTNEDWINQPGFSHTSSLSATDGGSFGTVNDATQSVTSGWGNVVDDWVTYTRVSPATGDFKWTVPSHIQAINCRKLRFFIYVDANNASGATFKLNGSNHAVTGWSGQGFFGWVEFTNPPSTLTSLEYSPNSNGISLAVKAIEFNGVILQNNIGPEGANGFHLKFNDISTNRNLGTDSINGKLANANGALPIYNTKAGATDNEIDYGDVKDTGYRADSSAGTTASTGLLLAVPGDSVASGTCDVHQAINTGESNKAATVTGAVVSTDESRFYGSSLYFDGVDDIIKFPGTALGTANFTIECWVKLPSSNYGDGGYSQLVGNIASSTAGYWRMGSLFNGSPNFWFAFSSGSYNDIMSGVDVHDDKWHHLAVVREGTGSDQLKMYVDGVFVKAHNCAQDLSQTEDWRLMASDQAGGFCRSKGYIQDVRVYKGVAKYTASFVPPTRNDFNVSNLWNADQQEIIGRVLISDATGARPFWETTDELGGTRSGTSVRSGEDTNLSWCLPFHESSGTPEYHNGSGIGSVSGGGSPSQSSDQSRFYGYSHYFPQNSRYSMSGPGGTFTWQAWCYFTNGGQQGLFSSQGSDNQGGTFRVSTSGYMGLWTKFGSSSHSAPNGIIPTWEWVHIAIQYDATNDIYKNFVNGEQKYSASESSNPGGSYELGTSYSGTNNYTLNGCYLSDVRMYSVAKYTADGFTVPKLGTTYDRKQSVFVDSPTNYLPTGGNDALGGVTKGNYATLNPLTFGGTLYEGNLQFRPNHASMAAATIAVNSGKYYWEFTCNSNDNLYAGLMGLGGRSVTAARLDGNDIFNISGSSGTASTNQAASTKTDHNSGFTGSILSAGDVIGIALDADAKTCDVYLNNTKKATFSSFTHAGPYLWAHDRNGSGSQKFDYNFGQLAFKYTAPAGYKCLCTQNLDDTFSGDQKNNPSKYFDIKTWTGTDTDDTDIKGFSFQPDLVWLKRRDAAGVHGVWDAIRGTNILDPSANATDTDYGTPPVGGYISQFISDGFRLKNGSTNNTYTHVGGGTYVGWAWDAGTAGAANDEGSTDIASPNQWKNATAGFSITKYTGNGASRTIGHGLGAKPDFWITKDLDEARTHAWRVWHKDLSGMNYRLELDEDDAEATSSTSWDNTAPTASVFSLGADDNTNKDGNDYIMYCWTAIPGYSFFGSYTGNASADGPFIHCGFRPKYVMVKNTDDGGPSNSGRNWVIRDAERDDDNPVKNYLLADANNGGYSYEGSTNERFIDITSNGFKVRSAVGSGDDQYTPNVDGDKYIVVAFAEHPFKTARAR